MDEYCGYPVGNCLLSEQRGRRESPKPVADRAVVVEISKDNAEHLVTILEVILDGGESSPADARLLETLAFDLRCKLDDLNA